MITGRWRPKLHELNEGQLAVRIARQITEEDLNVLVLVDSWWLGAGPGDGPSSVAYRPLDPAGFAKFNIMFLIHFP